MKKIAIFLLIAVLFLPMAVAGCDDTEEITWPENTEIGYILDDTKLVLSVMTDRNETIIIGVLLFKINTF